MIPKANDITFTPNDARGLPDRIVIVGCPEGRRVPLFQAALARLGRQPAEVVGYRELLAGRDILPRALRPGCLVRIESPEQHFEVEKRLIAAGAAEPESEDVTASFLDADAALRLEYDRGRLRHPRQWYRGFRALLRRLAGDLAACPSVRVFNHPDDIKTMFDKRLCQRRFADAGVPVPAGLGPAASFDELMERMRSAGRRRAFVKLAHGSSASGAVALALNGARMRAYTTVELVREGGETRLYNSRRVRMVETPDDIKTVLDALCREGVQAEEWIPKAGMDGHVFDLRVLVIAGRVRHIVPRLSLTPMTNLHLLNPRGDLQRVRDSVPLARWEAALESCRRAADLFPASRYAGVDLLFAPAFRRHAVLEINAFGDLLPGVLCDGRETYDDELLALADADLLAGQAAPG
jgi:glutathione synthase/RimK-type ligase-like ATP-grasp enzyme